MRSVFYKDNSNKCHLRAYDIIRHHCQMVLNGAKFDTLFVIFVLLMKKYGLSFLETMLYYSAWIVSLILGKILSYYGTKVMNRMLSSYTIYYIVSPWQQICWNISALQYYIRNVCLIIYYLKVTVAPAQLFFKQLLKQLWDDRIVQPTMLPTLVKYCMQSEFVHACNY